MSILNPEPLLRLRFNSATDDTTHTYDYADRQVSMTTYGTETATIYNGTDLLWKNR